MGGHKGQSSQQQTSTYTPSPAIAGGANQAIAGAENAASQPFQLGTQPIAGFTPQQQQAFQQYSALQNQWQPFYGQAANLFAQSGSPITGATVANYLNPYAGYVLGNLREQQGQQMADLTGKATQAAGGVGADRIAVAQGELARQQGLASGQTLAGLYGSALGAAQQGAQLQQGAAYGLGNLGASYLNSGLGATAALYGSGGYQQNLSQAQANAAWQNQLARLSYPFQTNQYLASIIGGLAPAMGGTSYGQGTSTPAQPSLPGQIIGGLGAIGGLAGQFGNPFSGTLTPNTGGANSAVGNPNGIGGLYDSGGAVYDDGGGVGGGVDDVNQGVGPLTLKDPGPTKWLGADSFIPQSNIQPQPMHYPQFMNMGSGSSGGSGSGSGSLGSLISGIGSIASGPIGSAIGSGLSSLGSAAMDALPLLLANRGGAVPHFDDGGGTGIDGDTPYNMYPEGTPFDARFQPAIDHPLGTPGRPYALGSPTWDPRPETPTPMPRPPGAPAPVVGGGTGIGGDTPYVMYPAGTPKQPPVLDTPPDTPPDRPNTQGPAPATEPEESIISPQVRGIMEGNARDMSGRTYSVPYSDLNPTQDRSRLAAMSPWAALTNAGAAMMASGSPWFGVAMGKGLLAGQKTLEDQRKALESEEGINLRARQLAQEAEFHRDTYTRITPVQAATIEQNKLRLEESGWQKGAENALTGETTWFNPRTGESGILKADGTWSPAKAGAAGNATPQQLQPPPAPAPVSTPSPVAPPPFGVPELAANLEPGASNIGFMGKGSPLARASEVDARTTLTQMNKSAATLPAMRMDLAAMKASMNTLLRDVDKDGFLSRLALQPGADFGERLEKAKQANALAVAAGAKPPFDPEKVAAAENINKIQKRMGLTFASQISPREAFQGQKIGIESSPGLTNSPQGFRRLLAGFQAAADNAQDELKFFNDYLKKNGTSLGWRQDFESKNPAERYIVRELINTLPQYNQQHLAEDVALLRKNPSEKNIKLFNQHYADTASYFLNGTLQ